MNKIWYINNTNVCVFNTEKCVLSFSINSLRPFFIQIKCLCGEIVSSLMSYYLLAFACLATRPRRRRGSPSQSQLSTEIPSFTLPFSAILLHLGPCPMSSCTHFSRSSLPLALTFIRLAHISWIIKVEFLNERIAERTAMMAQVGSPHMRPPYAEVALRASFHVRRSLPYLFKACTSQT